MILNGALSSPGLIVLRLVDDWITMGPHVVTTDVTGLRAVRETVEAVSEGQPTRSILSGIIDSIVQAESAGHGGRGAPALGVWHNPRVR